LFVVGQFFASATAGGRGGIELGLVGRAIETRQGVAFLERLALTERQFDNPPRQFTGKHRLVTGAQYTTGFAVGADGRCGRVVQQRIVRHDHRRQAHQAGKSQYRST